MMAIGSDELPEHVNLCEGTRRKISITLAKLKKKIFELSDFEHY